MTVPGARLSESRRESGRTAMSVGLAIAAVVLVAVVATGGRVPMAEEGSGGWRINPRPARSDLDTPTTIPPLNESPDNSSLPGEGVLAVLAQTMVLVVGGAAVILMARSLLRLREALPEHFELAATGEPPPPVDELVGAVEEGLAALASGPVDDVIVACWVRLEDAAASAGVGRRPSETSADLASRVLTDLQAPAEPVAELLRLYRTARYSHHRLGDEDRALAIRALEAVREAIAGVRR